MSVVTRSTSWQSTPVLQRPSSSSRFGGGPAVISASRRRPSTTASACGSGRLPMASSSAAHFQTARQSRGCRSGSTSSLSSQGPGCDTTGTPCDSGTVTVRAPYLATDAESSAWTGPLNLLLPSAGIKNPSIRTALLELLGKPIEQCAALVSSTPSYPLRHGPQLAWTFIAGQEPETPMAELGWKSVGVLELTALPSIPRTVWLPWLEAGDVLLVNGGDTISLDRWMRESGVAELLPSLDIVYVGLSAGSLVMSPAVSDDFASWTRPVGGEGLGFVDFEIFPHLDNPDLPQNTMADAERWAAGLTRSGYAIDDETAIKVVDGAAEVISEGHWRFFESP